LRGSVSLGALTMLTGCDPCGIVFVQKDLRAVSVWNDGVQQAISQEPSGAAAARSTTFGMPSPVTYRRSSVARPEHRRVGSTSSRNQIFENRELVGRSAVDFDFRSASDMP